MLTNKLRAAFLDPYGNLLHATMLSDDENEFYHEIAKCLLQLSNDHIGVMTDAGSLVYHIQRYRGRFSIRNIENNISGLKGNGKLPLSYLTCCNPENNDYKFYKLEERNGRVVVSFGRIGMEKDTELEYPREMYWIKYEEKISKGYIDQTAEYLDENKEGINITQVETEMPKDTDESYELYGLLKKCSRQLVEKTFRLTGSVTAGMAKKARAILNELYACNTEESFNNTLLQLLSLAQRNVIDVKSLLYKKGTNTFDGILEREESIVSAMEATVMGSSIYKKRSGCFLDIGVNVVLASEPEKNLVLEHLDSMLRDKVTHVYKVNNPEHEKRFLDYCARKNICNTKMLWHGSKNENWLSIIKNGLLLHPNAVITGKMFGNGIYFAPKSTKSWNYTSYLNAYYTNGKADFAFMGLYETAYGNPLDVMSSHQYTEKTIADKNCVHAHAGEYLLNDEIIFYNESAINLKYIVKFS